MEEPRYKRVLLKISGEALAGEKRTGLDFAVIGQVCDVIKEAVEMGVQVGVVVGAGNFWRGAKDGGGRMERTRADHMGMLGTAMNCLAVAEVLEQKGVDELQTPNFILRWKEIISNRLDGKALKAALPDVYGQFCKASTSRRFTIA